MKKYFKLSLAILIPMFIALSFLESTGIIIYVNSFLFQDKLQFGILIFIVIDIVLFMVHRKHYWFSFIFFIISAFILFIYFLFSGISTCERLEKINSTDNKHSIIVYSYNVLLLDETIVYEKTSLFTAKKLGDFGRDAGRPWFNINDIEWASDSFVIVFKNYMPQRYTFYY